MFTEAFDKGSTTCRVGPFVIEAHLVDDNDTPPPWKNEDGHGPVSEWASRPPEAGERVLSRSGPEFRYYDSGEALRIARADAWGPTPEEAVERDFAYLKAWCDGEWFYVGVALVVTLDGTVLTRMYDHAMWGCPDDDPAGLLGAANDLLPGALRAAKAQLRKLCAHAKDLPHAV